MNETTLLDQSMLDDCEAEVMMDQANELWMGKPVILEGMTETMMVTGKWWELRYSVGGYVSHSQACCWLIFCDCGLTGVCTCG